MDEIYEDNIIQQRYSRQVIFSPIGYGGQRKLLKSRVVFIGVGALGTVSVGILVRAGVGFVRIIDRDFVEESNLQRQVLFDEDDARRSLPKALAAEEKLKKINSALQCDALVEDVNYKNIVDFIRDADIVIDGTDNFETRYLINEACHRESKPWIYGGCVGSSGVSLSVIPGHTACLVCFLGEDPGQNGATETCDTAGVIGPAVSIVASLQAAEALKFLTDDVDNVSREAMFCELWPVGFTSVKISRNPNCPVCGKKEYKMLSGEGRQQSTSLCGRNAVQITPASKRNLSLSELQKKLELLGDVTINEFLLRFRSGDQEIIVFPDGRAIIKGTDSEKTARSLYAKYLGA